MKIGITGIGTANPVFKRAQLETADLIAAGLKLTTKEKRLLRAIYKATGIDYRHSVLSDYCKMPGEFEFFPNVPTEPYPSTAKRMQVYKEQALPLALAACLDIPELNKQAITHLITVSCTGMYAPGIDIEIISALGLNTTVQRSALQFMGCYGAFNAIRLAHSICLADPHASVLIICVEICTIHFQKEMSIDNMFANSIFADGAAALVVEANPSHKKYFSLEHFYCDLLPDAKHEMTWHIADFGFDIVLSSYIPRVIQSGILAFTERLLQKARLDLTQIDFYALHPGGYKILEASETAMQLTKEDNRYSYAVLRDYGNMSSATVPFVLKNIWHDLTLQDDNKTVFSCAFGPGLTLESFLLGIHCGAD